MYIFLIILLILVLIASLVPTLTADTLEKRFAASIFAMLSAALIMYVSTSDEVKEKYTESSSQVNAITKSPRCELLELQIRKDISEYKLYYARRHGIEPPTDSVVYWLNSKGHFDHDYVGHMDINLQSGEVVVTLKRSYENN